MSLMEKEKSIRTGYVSGEQKNKLFNLMQDRPALCSGRFSTSFTKKDGQKEWQNIATTLNSIPGGKKKTWSQWRTTWQDMRSKVKSKQASIKRHANATGGGPPLPTKLNENENNILGLISEVAVNGHSSIQESLVNFDFKDGNGNELPKDDVSLVNSSHQSNNENEFFMKDHDDYDVNGDDTVTPEAFPSPASRLPVHDVSPEKESIPPNKITKPLISVKKHTISSAKKLQQAASAAQMLSETADEKLQMKRAYYKRKLEILEDAENSKKAYQEKMLQIEEQKLGVEERKARALEKMCEMKQLNIDCFI